MVKEDNTSTISEKIRLTQSIKQINHKHPKKNSIPPKNNKSDTVNTIYKSMYTPGTNLCNKIFHIEKPLEINIHRNNKYVSDLSRQGEIL